MSNFSKLDKVSKYFSEYEVFHSNKADELGVYNGTSDPEILANVVSTAFYMDKIRENIGEPITVTSWYRSRAVNEALGSEENSQHRKGEAVDIKLSGRGKDNKHLFSSIVYGGGFDQVISEYPDKNGVPKWVHVSFKRDPSKNRGLVATIGQIGYIPLKVNNGSKYLYPKSNFKKIAFLIGATGFFTILGFLINKLSK